MGRRKLVVQKLEDPKARQITYCKRKYGITKKAIEISKLCDVDISVLMFSPRGKPTNFAGERSNLANVVGRLSRINIEDRETRKSETVDILARIYKTGEHEVDVKMFKDEGHEKVEEAKHKVKEIKETVKENKSRLRVWENIESIDDIEKLKEMEGKLINSIGNLHPHLEHLKGQNEQGPQNAHQVCRVPLMQLVGSLQNPRLGSPQRANTEQLVGRTIDEELIDSGRFGFRLDGSLLWFNQRGNIEENTIGHDINIGEIGVTNGFGFESSGHFQDLNLGYLQIANIGLQDVNAEGRNDLLSGCSQDLNPMSPQMYNIFGANIEGQVHVNVEGQVEGGNDKLGGCYQELNPGYHQIVNIEGQVPMNIEGGNELLNRCYQEINPYRANIEGQTPMNIQGQVERGNGVFSGYYQDLNYGVNVEGQAPVNVEEGNNLLSGCFQELNHGYPQIANIEGRAPVNIEGQVEGGNYLLSGYYQELNYLGYPQIENIEGQFMAHGEEGEQNKGFLSGNSKYLIPRCNIKGQNMNIEGDAKRGNGLYFEDINPEYTQIANVEREAVNMVINEEKVGGRNNFLSGCFKEINPGANIDERTIVNVEGEAEEDDLLSEWLQEFNFGENIEKQALNIEEGEGSNDLGSQDLIPRANIEGQDAKIEEFERGSSLGFNVNEFFHDPNSWVPQNLLRTETNMLNTGRENGLGYNASLPNSNFWLPKRSNNKGQGIIIDEEVWEASELENQFPFEQQVTVNQIQQLPLNNSTMNEGPNISDEANDLENQYMSQWECMMDEIERQLKEDDDC